MTTARKRRTRHDGWTRIRRNAFLDALAKTGNVTAAADAVGMSPQTAYRLRARDPAFARAWAISAKERMERFLDLAQGQILRGTVTTEFRGTRLVGCRVSPAHPLLATMLKRPARPSRKRIAIEFSTSPREKVTP